MLVNTYTSIENWRIFITAVPMGHMPSSLFSKWLVCSHMQQCRAYDVFIILLTPCKPLFLCCFKQPRLLFSCYLQNPHRVKSFLLLGPATLTSALFLLFFQYIMRFLFCGIQRKHGKTFWLLPQSPQVAEVLSSVPCHLQPTFFSTGSSVHSAPIFSQ